MDKRSQKKQQQQPTKCSRSAGKMLQLIIHASSCLIIMTTHTNLLHLANLPQVEAQKITIATTDQQRSQTSPAAAAAAVAAERVQQVQNKIGLAPHDRPACQLLPQQLANVQRRLSSANSLVDRQQSIDTQHHHFLEDNEQFTNLLLSNNSSSNLLKAKQQQQQLIINSNKQQQQFDSSERLRLLRGLLTQNNYDAYLVTSSDEHGSEYVADIDRRLKYISGFTGSAGYALILLDRAVLFTDGRYALQADQELDCNWWLVVGDNPLADISLWLKANAAQELRITSSARLMSMQTYDYLDEQIRSLGSKFELTHLDFIDEIRDSKFSNIYDLNNQGQNNINQQTTAAAASTPVEPLFVHPLQFTGNVSWQEKVVKLVDSMTRTHKAKNYIITQLDEVAWLLNLRGNDIPQSPLFKAFIIISVKPAAAAAAAAVNIPSMADGSGQVNSFKSNLIAARQPPSNLLSPIEQLQQTLNQQQQQQQQQQQSGSSQFVRLSLFVDLRKINQQVWDHLRVNNISLVVQQQQQRLVASLDSLDQQSTRIQVDLEDYNSFIKELGERLSSNSNPIAKQQIIQGRLLLNAGANVAIHALAKDYEDRIVLVESLVQKLKAVKSDGEVQGMRQAHWRDSLAISMLLAQLDDDISNNHKKETSSHKWTEISAAKELEFYRSLMDFNRGQSFDTISAYGSNAAIVHYRPNYEAAAAANNNNNNPSSVSQSESVIIGNQSTYLLDCGGQYLDGTTDITRTMHFGEPTEFQRETYTRVLMGAIDMMSLIFDQPKRSPYRISDLLARRHLFELGLDYAHGTGHGIGLYSLVHEAPALIEHYSSFSTASAVKQSQQSQQQQQSGSNSKGSLNSNSVSVESNPILLQPNMFSSVEPGYYKANDFGIRLENIVVTQRVQLRSSLSRPNDRLTSSSSSSSAAAAGSQQQQQQRQFLRFEPISLVPFEPKLIKLELLSNKQKSWLNSYNLMVRFRMTQQINHYLAKIRNHSPTTTTTTTTTGTPHSGQQQSSITIRGVSSSSQLHQQLLSLNNNNNSTIGLSINNNNNQQQQQQHQVGSISNDALLLGQHNWMRLDPGRLQEKLEHTHKWILSKTELIPLDVPQSFIVGQQQQQKQSSSLSSSSASSSSPISSLLFGRKRDSMMHHHHHHHHLASNVGANNQDPMNGQRLMLAYMSSMPFNDPEAGQAIESLNYQLQQEQQQQLRLLQLDARADNSTVAISGSSHDDLSEQPVGNKCHGFECDIWLVSALNSHPSQSSSSKVSAIKRGSGNGFGWPEMGESSSSSSSLSPSSSSSSKLNGNELAGSLFDLFNLKDTNAAATAANAAGNGSLWSIAVLSLIVVLQLGIMALMCGSGKIRPNPRRSNNGRRRNWCPQQQQQQQQTSSIENTTTSSSNFVALPSRAAAANVPLESTEMRQESMA